MLTLIIGSALTSLLTGLLFWYLEVKSNEKQKKKINGRYLLKANLMYKVIGIIYILVGVILMNIMILNWNEELFIIAPLTVSFFLIPGLFMLMFYYNYKIEFDQSRIIATNWKGSKKTLNWNELDKVKFIRSFKFLCLKSKSKKIFINQDSVGFINFIEIMELKTNYNVKNLKIH